MTNAHITKPEFRFDDEPNDELGVEFAFNDDPDDKLGVEFVFGVTTETAPEPFALDLATAQGLVGKAALKYESGHLGPDPLSINGSYEWFVPLDFTFEATKTYKIDVGYISGTRHPSEFDEILLWSLRNDLTEYNDWDIAVRIPLLENTTGTVTMIAGPGQDSWDQNWSDATPEPKATLVVPVTVVLTSVIITEVEAVPLDLSAAYFTNIDSAAHAQGVYNASGYWETSTGATGSEFCFGLDVVLDPTHSYAILVDWAPHVDQTKAYFYSLRPDHDYAGSNWNILGNLPLPPAAIRLPAVAFITPDNGWDWPVTDGETAVNFEVHKGGKVYGIKMVDLGVSV